MDRPVCKSCGKTLRPIMEEPNWKEAPKTREAAEALAAQHPGAKIRKPVHDDWAWTVSWPTGRFGYGGNDRFCTLRCGFDWATKYCPR